MMENLLRNDFTKHYNLSVSTINISIRQTTNKYFELKDDNNLIYLNNGQGVAKYKNLSPLTITVLNYESFINALPNLFRQNKEVCDLIVYSDNNKYFLLNELTDSQPQYVVPFVNKQGHQQGKRNKAINQLKSSLSTLISVITIKNFINNFSEKQCCFFNKQPNSPPIINAVTAFNLVNTISINGFKMSNPDIENYGFYLYEYSGNQVVNLN